MKETKRTLTLRLQEFISIPGTFLQRKNMKRMLKKVPKQNKWKRNEKTKGNTYHSSPVHFVSRGRSYKEKIKGTLENVLKRNK
jgi:hypothetical protein